MNEKIDSTLSLATALPPDELVLSSELSTGYDAATARWDLIVRFTGSLNNLREDPNYQITFLSNNFAIINTPKDRIDTLADNPQIIFIEKPKPLYFTVTTGRRTACITPVQNQYNLYGQGVLVAIIDSGIDYTHPAFLNVDGTTRIAYLWDQSDSGGTPPDGFNQGSEYSADQINEALSAPTSIERSLLVPSLDLSGHGTAVTGIAAGNFAADRRNQTGIATQSPLLIVKLSSFNRSYASTIELLEAIDYSVQKALLLNLPLVINLSFGNNYGSHDGQSLLETYIDEICARERISVVIGTGNEGNSGGHTGGTLRTGNIQAIELAVSEYQFSFNIQLWKSYVDEFEIELLSPDGKRIELQGDASEVTSYSFSTARTTIFCYYGMPKPYRGSQEIFLEFLPMDSFVAAGIWTIRLQSQRSRIGNYDLWLPTEASLGTNTRFLTPTPDITLTTPSSAANPISVGAYDSRLGSYADFSGRGFTRETNQIKPDLVAPGVDIITARAGGGLVTLSGTSMAAPFVSGAAALLMEWGIVRGNDPYLYGQKLKAYLHRGAKQLSGENTPSPRTGYGALCLQESLRV